MNAYKTLVPVLALILALAVFSCKDTSEDMEITAASEQYLTVAFVMGDAVVQQNDRTQTLRVGMQLGQGNTLITLGDESGCTLQTPSGTTVRLAGDTQLLLDELYKDDTLNIEKTGLELAAGTILVRTSALVRNDEFSVRTRTAVAGVRGTEFLVSYSEEAGTDVAVQKGRVAVSRNVSVDLPEEYKQHEAAVNTVVQQESEVVIQPNQRIRVSQDENAVYQQQVQQRVNHQIEALQTRPDANAGEELVLQTRQAAVQARPQPAVTRPTAADQEKFRLLEESSAVEQKTPAADPERPQQTQRPAATTGRPSGTGRQDVPAQLPGEIRDERFPR